MEAFQRSVETPNHKALLLRKTYQQLKRTLLRYMREFFPKDLGRFVKTEMTYHFPNGSLIDFGYLDKEADKYQYQGAEYDFIGFEELTQFQESDYLYLFSSVRSPKRGSMPVMRSTSNPGNIGHNWVKARFIDPAPDMEKWKVKVDEDQTITRQFIPATVFENEFIMENDPDYVKRLKLLPEDQKQAYLYGNWDVFGGQVFKEFDRRLHEIEPFEIPASWAKYMAVDWGYRDPFCIHWAAVTPRDVWKNGIFFPENCVVVYREYYGCPKSKVNTGLERDADLVAEDICEMEEEIVHIRIGDHDMFARSGSGETIAEIFGSPDFGIFLQKANKGSGSRIQGKQQVHKRLRPREKDDGTQYAYTYFFEPCRAIIRTLPALPYSNKNVEDVDTNAEDHPYDSYRYILQSRPLSKEKKKKKKKKEPKKGWNKYVGY